MFVLRCSIFLQPTGPLRLLCSLPARGEARVGAYEINGANRMCLTAEALAVFLNIIGLQHVSTEPGRIIVHAESADVHWVLDADEWCTMAPQLDRLARLDPAPDN